MQKSNAPTKLTVAFASGTGAGPVNTVPLTPGSTPGTASYQTGFTSVNMEPIASGGVPPFGADFNGLFKDATLARMWQEAGYTYSFDAAFAGNANIGGYPAGSVLLMGSGKGFWLNQTDNNTQSPDATGAAGWIGLPASGTYTITTTGGTTTPDPSTLGVTTLLVTGALTSNATIVLPLSAGARWIIANNTTGSFTLTVQGATGSGVSITQGSALTVFTDGTSYFAASANISGQYLPIDGTAVAATKLATARAFSITGLATAAAINFDGTGNVTFNVTALNVAGALGYTAANAANVVNTFNGRLGEVTLSSTDVDDALGYTPVETVAIASANGVSGTVEVSGATQTATLELGAITPNSISCSGNVSAASANISGTASLGGLSISQTNGLTAYGSVGTGSYNPINQSGDFSLVQAGQNTIGVGALTLTTWSNTETGIRLAANGNNTLGGNFTCTGSFTCTTINATGSDRRLKRNIRKAEPRPLHRAIAYVSFDRKADGSHGRGAIAQVVQKFEPAYVGTFKIGRATRLSLDYQSMAYEQAIWAGHELDRQAKLIEKQAKVIAKLEARLAKLERAA